MTRQFERGNEWDAFICKDVFISSSEVAHVIRWIVQHENNKKLWRVIVEYY